MKHQIQSLRARATDCLRRACGRISPDARVKVIVAAFCLFAVVNILVVASAIRNIGREADGKIPVADFALPNFIPDREYVGGEGKGKLEGEREADSLGLELRRFPNDNFNIGGQDNDRTNE